MPVEYLGTKIGMSKALYPKEYKQQVIEIDSKPYDMVQKTFVFIERSKMVKDNQVDTFTKLVDQVGEDVESKLKAEFDDRHNFEAFSIIKFVDHNLNGNLYDNIDLHYKVAVEIHIRKAEPKKKTIAKPTKEEVQKALVYAKKVEKPKKQTSKNDKTK